MTRINGTDPTKPESYTNAEHVAVKQIKSVTEYLQKFVPGFENA